MNVEFGDEEFDTCLCGVAVRTKANDAQGHGFESLF